MPKLQIVTMEDDIIELESEGYNYYIKNEKDWIALTHHKAAYLLVSYPSGHVSTQINQKFLNNQHYKLLNDLNFEGIPLKSWMYFGGILEGNNKKISNINLTDDNDNGLFGISYHCIIKNLTIENCSIQNLSMNNGVLIGQISEGIFENINILGNINISGDYAGIIASNFNGRMDNCKINVTSNKNNLFNSFTGNFHNSYIEINSEGENNNPLFCKYFNGGINNCYFISNNDDLIFKTLIDGFISNSMFTFHCDKKINTHNKLALHNCIVVTDVDKVIYNKCAEIHDVVEQEEWDREFWSDDNKLKSFAN